MYMYKAAILVFPQETVHFSGTAHNVSLSALSIRDPDCHGFLFKQGYNIRSWKKRYCVLKDHQLFYYGKMHHTTAYGVMNLHGYSVAMGRTTEKKFYFQAPPPERHMRTYYFYCETAVERDRYATYYTTVWSHHVMVVTAGGYVP
jgi:tripartite motif-containing protein 2/3